MMKTTLPLLAALLLLQLAALNAAEPEISADSPRRTPTVELAAAAEPAVVAIYAEKNGAVNSGSGTVISPQGFILTNDHVVRNHTGQVLFYDGSVRPFRVVG